MWPRCPGRTSTDNASPRLQQCSNAFLQYAKPHRFQALADSLTARDLLSCGEKWLRQFTPFFTSDERRRAGCQHRLFCSQVEFCDNLIFHRRAARLHAPQVRGRDDATVAGTSNTCSDTTTDFAFRATVSEAPAKARKEMA